MPTVDLKAIYRAFDHTARLESMDLYVKRDRAPSEEIMSRMALDGNRHWIFCGSIGSGKSSELAYLGHLLQDRSFVIGLDLYQSVDDVQSIRPAEVLMLIGAAAVRTFEEWYSKSLPKAQKDALYRAFAGVLAENSRQVDVAKIIEGVALTVWGAVTANKSDAGKGVAMLTGAMGTLFKGKHRTPLGGLTRPSLREADADLVALLDAVNDILQHIEIECGKSPVVLIDGLDKLNSMEIIRPLFCSSLLSDIRGASVYAAPVTLMLQTEWQNASAYFERERLTNLVVTPSPHCSIEDEFVSRGRALMREVVERRCSKLGHDAKAVFADDALDLLITESGGVIRTLVQLVRQSAYEAISRKESLITASHANRAIDELAQDFQITMNSKWRAELETLRDQGEPSSNTTAFELYFGNFVLPYRNGRSWWAPAPLALRGL